MTDMKKSNLDIDVFPRLVSQAQADKAMPYEKRVQSSTEPFCKVRYGWKQAVIDTLAFIVAIGALMVIWVLGSAIV